MPKPLLSALQRAALRHLLTADEALVQDVASAIKDTRPRVRGAMRALADRGLVHSRSFQGMVGRGERMHQSRCLVYQITAAGRALLTKEESMPGATGIERAPHRGNQQQAAMEVVLLELIEMIDGSGGVRKNELDTWCLANSVDPFPPEGRHEIEAGYAPNTLAALYVEACRILKRKPKIARR